MECYLRILVRLFLLGFLVAGVDSTTEIRVGRGGKPNGNTTRPLWQRMKRKVFEHPPGRIHLISTSAPPKTALIKASHISQPFRAKGKYMTAVAKPIGHRTSNQILRQSGRKRTAKIKLKRKNRLRLQEKSPDRRLHGFSLRQERYMRTQQAKRKHHNSTKIGGKEFRHRTHQKTQTIGKIKRKHREGMERVVKTLRPNKQPLGRVQSIQHGREQRRVGSEYKILKTEKRQSGRNLEEGHLSMKGRKQPRKKGLPHESYMKMQSKIRKDKQGFHGGGHAKTNVLHGKYAKLDPGGLGYIQSFSAGDMHNRGQLDAQVLQKLNDRADILAEMLHHGRHGVVRTSGWRHLKDELSHHTGQSLAEQIHNGGHLTEHYGGDMGMPLFYKRVPMQLDNMGELDRMILHQAARPSRGGLVLNHGGQIGSGFPVWGREYRHAGGLPHREMYIKSGESIGLNGLHPRKYNDVHINIIKIMMGRGLRHRHRHIHLNNRGQIKIIKGQTGRDFRHRGLHRKGHMPGTRRRSRAWRKRVIRKGGHTLITSRITRGHELRASDRGFNKGGEMNSQKNRDFGLGNSIQRRKITTTKIVSRGGMHRTRGRSRGRRERVSRKGGHTRITSRITRDHEQRASDRGFNKGGEMDPQRNRDFGLGNSIQRRKITTTTKIVSRGGMHRTRGRSRGRRERVIRKGGHTRITSRITRGHELRASDRGFNKGGEMNSQKNRDFGLGNSIQRRKITTTKIVSRGGMHRTRGRSRGRRERVSRKGGHTRITSRITRDHEQRASDRGFNKGGEMDPQRNRDFGLGNSIQRRKITTTTKIVSRGGMHRTRGRSRGRRERVSRKGGHTRITPRITRGHEQRASNRGFNKGGEMNSQRNRDFGLGNSIQRRKITTTKIVSRGGMHRTRGRSRGRREKVSRKGGHTRITSRITRGHEQRASDRGFNKGGEMNSQRNRDFGLGNSIQRRKSTTTKIVSRGGMHRTRGRSRGWRERISRKGGHTRITSRITRGHEQRASDRGFNKGGEMNSQRNRDFGLGNSIQRRKITTTKIVSRGGMHRTRGRSRGRRERVSRKGGHTRITSRITRGHEQRASDRGFNKGGQMISQRKRHFRFGNSNQRERINVIRSRSSRHSGFGHFFKIHGLINVIPQRKVRFGFDGLSKGGHLGRLDIRSNRRLQSWQNNGQLGEQRRTTRTRMTTSQKEQYNGQMQDNSLQQSGQFPVINVPDHGKSIYSGEDRGHEQRASDRGFNKGGEMNPQRNRDFGLGNSIQRRKITTTKIVSRGGMHRTRGRSRGWRERVSRKGGHTRITSRITRGHEQRASGTGFNKGGQMISQWKRHFRFGNSNQRGRINVIRSRSSRHSGFGKSFKIHALINVIPQRKVRFGFNGLSKGGHLGRLGIRSNRRLQSWQNNGQLGEQRRTTRTRMTTSQKEQYNGQMQDNSLQQSGQFPVINVPDHGKSIYSGEDRLHEFVQMGRERPFREKGFGLNGQTPTRTRINRDFDERNIETREVKRLYSRKQMKTGGSSKTFRRIGGTRVIGPLQQRVGQGGRSQHRKQNGGGGANGSLRQRVDLGGGNRNFHVSSRTFGKIDRAGTIHSLKSRLRQGGGGQHRKQNGRGCANGVLRSRVRQGGGGQHRKQNGRGCANGVLRSRVRQGGGGQHRKQNGRGCANGVLRSRVRQGGGGQHRKQNGRGCANGVLRSRVRQGGGGQHRKQNGRGCANGVLRSRVRQGGGGQHRKQNGRGCANGVLRSRVRQGGGGQHRKQNGGGGANGSLRQRVDLGGGNRNFHVSSRTFGKIDRAGTIHSLKSRLRQGGGGQHRKQNGRGCANGVLRSRVRQGGGGQHRKQNGRGCANGVLRSRVRQGGGGQHRKQNGRGCANGVLRSRVRQGGGGQHRKQNGRGCANGVLRSRVRQGGGGQHRKQNGRGCANGVLRSRVRQGGGGQHRKQNGRGCANGVLRSRVRQGGGGQHRKQNGRGCANGILRTSVRQGGGGQHRKQNGGGCANGVLRSRVRQGGGGQHRKQNGGGCANGVLRSRVRQGGGGQHRKQNGGGCANGVLRSRVRQGGGGQTSRKSEKSRRLGLKKNIEILRKGGQLHRDLVTGGAVGATIRGGGAAGSLRRRIQLGGSSYPRRKPGQSGADIVTRITSLGSGRQLDNVVGRTLHNIVRHPGVTVASRGRTMFGGSRHTLREIGDTLRRHFGSRLDLKAGHRFPQRTINHHIVHLPAIRHKSVTNNKASWYGGDCRHAPDGRGMLKRILHHRGTINGHQLCPGNSVQDNILLKNGGSNHDVSKHVAMNVPLTGSGGRHREKTFVIHELSHGPIHVGVNLHVMISPHQQHSHKHFKEVMIQPMVEPIKHPHTHFKEAIIQPMVEPIMEPMEEGTLFHGEELPRSYHDVLRCLSCMNLGSGSIRKRRSVPAQASSLDHALYQNFKLLKPKSSVTKHPRSKMLTKLTQVTKSHPGLISAPSSTHDSTDPFLRLRGGKVNNQIIAYLNNSMKAPNIIQNANKFGPNGLFASDTHRADLLEMPPSKRMGDLKLPFMKPPGRVQYQTKNTTGTTAKPSTKLNERRLSASYQRNSPNQINIDPLKTSTLLKRWKSISQNMSKPSKPIIDATEQDRGHGSGSSKLRSVTPINQLEKSKAPYKVLAEVQTTTHDTTVGLSESSESSDSPTEQPVRQSSSTDGTASKSEDLDNFMEKVFPHIKQHIYGGHIAPRGRWPWQVTIQRKHWRGWQHICGGTIIKPTVVITAAHCITPHRNRNLRVVAGDYGLSEPETSEQIRFPESVIIHPDFNGSLRASPHDLSLLRFSKSFEMSDNVLPIHHYHGPQEDEVYHNPYVESEIELPQRGGGGGGGPCFITGWSDSPENPDELSNFLHESQIFLISNRECQRHYPVKNLILNSHICAFRKHTGTCDGDSGGPLVCRQNNNFRLVGVSSWGMDTCHGRPSVFVRVKTYKKWIDDQLT